MPVQLSTGLLLLFCPLPMQKAGCKGLFCRLSGISFQNAEHQYMLLAALCFLCTGTKSPSVHKLLTEPVSRQEPHRTDKKTVEMFNRALCRLQ